jgi:hypothetical protein
MQLLGSIFAHGRDCGAIMSAEEFDFKRVFVVTFIVNAAKTCAPWRLG